MTIAEQLKHDFDKGVLRLYDINGNEIYYEHSNGAWSKQEYDSKGNKIYHENSDGVWDKWESDSNGNTIYYENSDGVIIDNRPKPSCEGKIVEIEGRTYKLIEFD